MNHKGNRNVTHGKSSSRIYRVFHGMRQRCNNPKSKCYKAYGGRGIRVCPEWDSADGFRNFYDWAVNNGYADDLSIDRIDVNKGYEPSNCRWVTSKAQARNKRTNVFVEIEGRKSVATDIAIANDLSPRTVLARIRAGWQEEDLLSATPQKRTVEYNGQTYRLDELSKITGMNENTLNTRFSKGYRDEDITKRLYQSLRRPVCQYTNDGKLIGVFDSATDASHQTGVRRNCINMCCRGQRKHAGGYVWSYADESVQDRKSRCFRRKKEGGWVSEEL